MKHIKIFILAALGFAAFTNVVKSQDFRRAQTFEDAWAASCRVCVSSARGTGCFVGTVGNVAYILTNYHVVTNDKTARLDFWTNGRMESVTAKVALRAYNQGMPADFALLTCDAQELKVIDPPWVALGGADASPSVGAVIVSSGAPDGRFPQCWKGQVLEYYNGKTAIFSPPPVPGQSGSAICEYVDGELFVTGILTWLIGEKGRDDSKGGAIPIANLYKAIGARGTDVDWHGPDSSPIPPNATECADVTAVAPCVLEFTQENCPPCEDAKKDVNELKAAGFNVYVFDVASERGAEYVARYGIEKTPSFVVLDDRFNKAGIFTGAGHYDEIKALLERFRGGLVNEPPAIKEKDEEPAPAETFLDSLPIPRTNFSDFRQRPAVYEVSGDVGLFDESDQRWQDLKNKHGKLFGRDDNEENDGENEEKRPRIGDKIKDNLLDSIADKLNAILSQHVEKATDTARKSWNNAKYSLIAGLIFIVALGVVIADVIVGVFKILARKVSTKYTQIRAALEVAKKEPDKK